MAKIILRDGSGYRRGTYGLICQNCECTFIFDDSELVERDRGFGGAVECPKCKSKLHFEFEDSGIRKSLL